MKIDFVDIQNFRKLKNCRIEFSDDTTVFVGANNSGKTTAMEALILFFKKQTSFTTRDFTLSNWSHINSIGHDWSIEKDLSKIDLTIDPWQDHVPTLDIWLSVSPDEIHHVNNLIPTLDWNGGSLGVRMRFEPKDIETLYKEYTSLINNSTEITSSLEAKNKSFKLWPKDMWDFLDTKLESFFTIKSYLLDPTLKESPQPLSKENTALESSAFKGLIKVDIINAQRGFSDVNSEGTDSSVNVKNLSSQLRGYYDKHLNPTVNPTVDDLKALQAIQKAKEIFDENLKESFGPSISELELLNYPGFGHPTINLSTNFETVDGLNHSSSVQYNLIEGSNLSLPEKYNGLGYQNLISMIFKLIRFRDEWMQVGKRFSKDNKEPDTPEFEPLHLVLIEEPEAHLHAQVQQVFIKEAFKVLRNHENLKSKRFTTQLIVSTHSNHIAHETSFCSLRYFKRQNIKKGEINTSTVVNLSTTFGTEDDTTRFATRYLKSTHCDLFFADAVILVEGPAERMLVPYFIQKQSRLAVCYISILEIGGSHAHTLQALIENLGIITLIITDLDSVNPTNNNKTQPILAKGLETDNDTLKKWIPKIKELDSLLKLSPGDKEDKKFPVRVCYQIPIEIEKTAVNPYTFEDSLVMENREFFQKLGKGNGLLKKMTIAANEKTVERAATAMYEAITHKGAKKAEFALELFYLEESQTLICPGYIQQGLNWLEEKLINKKEGLVSTITEASSKDESKVAVEKTQDAIVAAIDEVTDEIKKSPVKAAKK